MNPDDFKDLSDELEAIKKGDTKACEARDYDTAIKEGDFDKYIFGLITSTPVTWEDIAGLDKAKKTIVESYLISIIENKIDAIEPCKSILLFGPPGTGKTLLAAATAGTLKSTFFNVKTGDLLSKYYGESSKIISALYNAARKMAPSIIFLDEFDSIGGNRNDISEASRRVLSTLLSEMDGVHNKKSSQNVLTMAATNTPWYLDSAALSRFEMKIYVPLPDEQAVLEMIKLNTRKKGVELDADIQKIAQICVSKLFSGRDVAALCREAIKNMVREQNDWDKIRNLIPDDIKNFHPEIRPLTKSDFKKSLARIKGTVKKRDVIEHENWAIEIGSDVKDGPAKDEHRCEINEPEIYRKAMSENVFERKEAAYEIGKNFTAFTDKERSTKVLLNFTKDNDNGVRRNAAEAIGSAFIHLTDRDRATKDLFALIKDENWKVRSVTAKAIGSTFKYLTYMDRATKDLLNLAEDNDSFVRRNAAEAIGTSFFYLTNKGQATEVLLTLAKDKDIFVQRNAVEAIGSAFSQVTDKVQAWNDLLVLIKRDDRFVLIGAAYALGSAFPHVTDKDQATKDLLALINDNDTDVRTIVAETFGSVFPYVADKDQATENLLALTMDKKSIVRAYANHSLGRAYVFKATESKDEENFRKELEQALQFFEKSSREEIDWQPARFCLPFYRSFYMLTFKKEEAKAEVQKYLEEAKSAVEGSHSKEKLLEAVKNLGNALKEVQNLKEKDFNGLKCDLNAYRNYCERAAEMLEEVEGNAPGAAQLLRRGLPIFDEGINRILAEIQEKATALCKSVKDTPLKNLGTEVNLAGQCLAQIRDPISLIKQVQIMQNALSAICARMPAEERGDACELLKRANDEKYIEDKLDVVNLVLSKIPSQIGGMKKNIVNISGNVNITNIDSTDNSRTDEN